MTRSRLRQRVVATVIFASWLGCGARVGAEPIPRAATCQDFVAEAARTAGLPEPWVTAVMRAESGGETRAVSSAGAQGCMQILPSTWRELQGRGIAGPDPFEPRANMIAGAVYLRAMRDRYGWPDALAAYHAGPGRFDDYLATGHPLPTATPAYVARIESWLDARDTRVEMAAIRPPRWTDTAIFVGGSGDRANASIPPPATLPDPALPAPPADTEAPDQAKTGAGDTLFAVHRP